MCIIEIHPRTGCEHALRDISKCPKASQGPRPCGVEKEIQGKHVPGCCDVCWDNVVTKLDAMLEVQKARQPELSPGYWEGHRAGWIEGYEYRMEERYRIEEPMNP